MPTKLFAQLLVGLSWAAQLRAASQALNLSNDLVRWGIAASNAVPNQASLDARPLFDAGIRYALAHKIPVVTVTRGTYYFLSKQTAGSYLLVESAHDLTLDLGGSELLFRDSFHAAITLYHGRNVTLENFSVDFLNLPFTQLRIKSVNPTSRVIQCEKIAGWPMLSDAAQQQSELWALVFRNGALIPGTNRVALQKPTRQGELRIAVSDAPWVQPAVLANYREGDIAVITARGGPAAVFIDGGERVTVRNVAIFASGSLGLQMDQGKDSRVEAVGVIPKPDTPRLISTNADGLHISNVRARVVITNNTIRGTMDDGIAVNSQFYAFAMRRVDQKHLFVRHNFATPLQNNMAIMFVNRETGMTIGYAKIIAQDARPATPSYNGQMVRLTFDRDLPPLGEGDGLIPADPSERGAGTMVQNNTVENVWSARGIFLGGVSGVTVQNNFVRETSGGGIVVHQDLAAYPSGPSSDIRIAQNIVEGAIGPAAMGTGAITGLAAIFSLATDRHFAPQLRC